MRLVFAGTPEFAEKALAALHQAGHEIGLVLSQPDRPAGRGLRMQPEAVKRYAVAHGLPLLQPESLASSLVLARVNEARPQALVVAAYGALLPQALLDAAPLGALNIHASLLPRWRGAAPIQRAILAGDHESGISIMKMDAGLDTGALLAQQPVPIAAADDAGSLHDKLAGLGARMMIETLARLEAGALQAAPQSASGACYARKIGNRDTLLDWTRPAVEVERAVRAFRPAPGAATSLGSETIKIWRASVAVGGGAPGELIAVKPDALLIACGEGALEVLELQRAGGRRLPAREFQHGRPLKPGIRFV